MAKFKTRFSELGFYVNGSLCRFKGGIYVTDNKDEIAVLEKLADVQRIDEETKPKAEPKPKATSPKGKTSAKK